MAMVLASKIDQVVILRKALHDDVELGAQSLLGCNLVLGNMVAQIVETEAYTWDDPGCHAYKKDRMKNMAMYGPAGTAYVYFTYGNHWMINVVADELGRAGAVLIRAAMPISGLDEFRTNRPGIKKDRELLAGPGRLTKAFGIDSRFNEMDILSQSSELNIVSTKQVPAIGVSPRIGNAAGKGDELMRRYVDLNYLDWVTRHAFNSVIFRGHKN
jgi:DNA-3-methyladenine glycosylase